MSLLEKVHTVAQANSSAAETTQANTIDLCLDYVCAYTAAWQIVPNYSHLAPQLAIVDDEVTRLHDHKGSTSRAVGPVSGNNI